MNAPHGFRPINSAPRDGTFMRLRFRPGILRPADREEIGAWQAHSDMPAGGSWFTRAGEYISPGPLYWAPETGTFN